MARKLIGILLLALPTFCWSIESGFYAGLGVGADTTNFKKHTHVTSPGSFDVIENNELGAQGAFGTLFGGYGYHNGMYYVAGELNGNISNAAFNTSNTDFLHGTVSNTTYKINRSWGLSALPGIILAESTLIYGRLGYAGGHFVVSTSDSSLTKTALMLNGFRWGLGLEKNVYKNFDLRVEYSHVSYQDQNSNTFDPIGSVTKQTTVTPDTNQVEFSLVYRLV